MSYDLLGYLLGALEPSEQEEIEEALMRDPALRAELEELRRAVPPTDQQVVPVEPPGDLAPKTFKFVMDRLGPCRGQFAACSSWRPTDLIVAAVVLIAATLVIIPAMKQGRQHAQVRVCQRNLVGLSQALFAFSQAHDGKFPEVPLTGHEAVAGIYAPRLREAGLITDEQVLCPATVLAAREAMDGFRIPTLIEIHLAQGVSLRELQRRMGGSYGYSFGYVDDDTYHAVRNLGRATFALMADHPEAHGAGQNVLFEDGQVRLLTARELIEGGDDIFRNALGYVGVGIHEHDSVIGRSDATPFMLRTVNASGR